MSKVTIAAIASDYRSSQALSADLSTLAGAFDNTLSLDGTTPNSMLAPLDLNGNHVLNAPTPVLPTDLVRLQDVTNITGSPLQTYVGPLGVSVTNFGAKGDGVTNDTSAIQATIAYVLANRSSFVFLPAGSYLVDPMTFNNVMGLTIIGANNMTTSFVQRSTGNIFNFSNANNVVIQDVRFINSGGVASTSAVVFTNGGGNCTFERCWFIGFKNYGVFVDGNNTTGMSGFKFNNNYFLSCLQAGLYGLYCEDFHIINNQFGVSGAYGTPAVGSLLQYSSQGTYIGNYHWSNTRGHQAYNCIGIRYNSNRFEINLQEGIYWDTCSYIDFDGNHVHSNSQSNFGQYDSMYVVNCAEVSVVSNQFYTWDTSYVRYCLNVSTGNSAIKIKDNTASGATTYPYHIDSSLTLASNISTDYVMQCLSGTAVTSGTTTYLGPGGPTSAVEGAVTTNIGIAAQPAILYFAGTSAPGVGQTFTATLMVNSTATSTVAVISGTAFAASAINLTTPVNPNDNIDVKIVSSAGAASSYLRATVLFIER